LIGAGKPAALPAVLVESTTLPDERRLHTTLGALAAAPLPRAEGPVVMAIGEVFRERAALDALAHEEPRRRAS
jgi:siroheme synthase